MAMSMVFVAPSRKPATLAATESAVWPPSVRKKKSVEGTAAIATP
jgi:hypothetical protein